jgi:hypothetical protein
MRCRSRWSDLDDGWPPAGEVPHFSRSVRTVRCRDDFTHVTGHVRVSPWITPDDRPPSLKNVTRHPTGRSVGSRIRGSIDPDAIVAAGDERPHTPARSGGISEAKFW